MGRSRLAAVLHEESWNRLGDLGHSNLTRQVTMLGGWSTAEARVKTGDSAAFQPAELRPRIIRIVRFPRVPSDTPRSLPYQLALP
jgi:hypothetical protein